MITSKLTSKEQTTIPQAVRAALQLKAGDAIVYVLEEGRVAIMKARPLPVDDPFVNFEEWDGEADRRAISRPT